MSDWLSSAWETTKSAASTVANQTDNAYDATWNTGEALYNDAATSMSGRYDQEDMQSWSLREIAIYMQQLNGDGFYKEKPKKKNQHIGMYLNRYTDRVYGSKDRDGPEGVVRQMAQSIQGLSDQALNWDQDDWEAMFT